MLLGKLEEARQILAANWRLNAPPHANTTPRLAFLRHLIALLESQPDRSESRVHAATANPGAPASDPARRGGDDLKRAGSEIGAPFLGQLKTLLTGPELPVASDVAIPWDIAYFIEFLKPKLGELPAEFLTALVAALNDRTNTPEPEQFSEWKNQPPIPLDAPWPVES